MKEREERLPLKRTNFRNENSERLNENISYLQYFKNAPMSILKLAKNETLQYLLENVNGHLQPVITTIFWIGRCGQFLGLIN